MGKDRKNSGQVLASDLVPVAVEEWSVAPASLDDWAVEAQETEPTSPRPPKKKKASASSKKNTDGEAPAEGLDETPKKTSKKLASKGKKGAEKSSDGAPETQKNSASVDGMALEVQKTPQPEVAPSPSPKVLEALPVAVGLDAWAEPEPVSLDQWGIEDSETEDNTRPALIKEDSEIDQFVDVFETDKLDFESLDEYLESDHHPVLAESHGSETHAPLDDTPLPEDSFRAAEELYKAEALPDVTMTTGSLNLDFNVDSDSIQLDLSSTPEPQNKLNTDDNVDSFVLDFEVAQDDFEGSLDVPANDASDDAEDSMEVSEKFFEEQGQAPSITPTQTRTVQVNFLEQELSEGLAPRDPKDESKAVLINNDEDLGLDIDDLSLPGTELETVANFNVSTEESFDFAIKDQDEEEGFFDLRTVATMIESSESLEEESAAAHFESYNKTKPFEVVEVANEGEEAVDATPSLTSNPLVTAPALPDNSLVSKPALVSAPFASTDSLPPIVLSPSDLADHQVVVLTLEDLRENSHLAVLCLSERDLAANHRIVFNLDETYFLDNGIQQNMYGVIILKASDLVHPEALEETTPAKKEVARGKIRKVNKEFKASLWDRISPYLLSTKVNLWACFFLVLAISTVYQFKYSWTTVSEERYQEIKFKSSAFGWYTSTMFKYRTQDSAWRWFGQQLLRPSDYEKAIEQSSSAWIYYDKSQEDEVGDRFE